MLRLEQVYQAVALIVIVLVFDRLERGAPGFSVDRRRELPLNIAAMLLVVVAGEKCKDLADWCLDALNAAALSGNFLTGLPFLPKILLAVTLTDFALYWVHRFMHRPLLWRTHAFHHTIPEIWWLAGSRTSVTHLFLFALPQLFIGRFLLGMDAREMGLALSFGVLVNIWIHVNLWVKIGPLDNVLITPNFHRVHHGAKGLSNRNLGFVFTIWDRLFGTHTAPRETGKDFQLFPVPTEGRLLRLITGV
jgi:sterol desaturase/sphingolipid hydroxylase (fatty acid hydroxylase superfamily)